MQANKKITVLLVPSLLIFLLSGCLPFQNSAGIILQPNSSKVEQSDAVSKRFLESTAQGPTVVESAIELSEKYAKLSEETAALRTKNQNFIAENQHLKDQVAALDTQLQQTQKELAEANDLLIEMRIELNNWKADILGFRGEMRDAEKAQLQALLKILNVLGGEVKAESPQAQDVGSTAVSAGETTRLQAQSQHTGTILGESK
jgi:chromosome segregation ATPase